MAPGHSGQSVPDETKRLPRGAGEREVCRFFGLSGESCARLAIYVAALQRWNPHINLVASSTLNDAWVRHVADSLQLLPLVPDHVTQIIDLGSGSGVPGLVLALAAPGKWDMHLVEAAARKCAFLRRVAQESGIDVKIHHRRIEDVDVAALGAGRQTLVTARALAPLPGLLALAAPFLQRGAAALLPKGRAADEEIAVARRGGWRFALEIFPSVTQPGARILRLSEVRHD